MRLQVAIVEESLLKKNQPQLILINGDDEYLLFQAEQEVRQFAKILAIEEVHFMEVDNKFDWNQFDAEWEGLSLFASTKLFGLRFRHKPDAKLQAAVLQRMLRIAPEYRLVLFMPKLESKVLDSEWVKYIDTKGLVITCTVPKRQKLPEFIHKLAMRHKITLSKEVVELLASYEEGNLLGLSQELARLSLLFGEGKHVELSDIRGTISDSARFNLFDLNDAILLGDVVRIKRMIEHLKSEGQPIVLINWTLQKEVELRYQLFMAHQQGQLESALYKTWEHRRPYYRRLIPVLTQAHCQRDMQKIITIDRAIKGELSLDPWLVLLRLSFSLAGKPLWRGLSMTKVLP